MITFELNDFCKRQAINERHAILSVVKFLKEHASETTWVAGGAVMSLLLNRQHYTDIDIFFASDSDLQMLEYNLDTLGARKIFTSANAVSYDYLGNKFQLIKRKFYQSPKEIFEDFDFTISMLAISATENKLYCNKYTLWDLANRQIHIHNVNALGSTFKRVVKYGAKGYKIPLPTYERLASYFTANTHTEQRLNEVILPDNIDAPTTIPIASVSTGVLLSAEPHPITNPIVYTSSNYEDA